MKENSKSRKIFVLLLIIPMLFVSLFILTACGKKGADIDLRQNTYYCHYDQAAKIYHYVAVKTGNKFEYVRNKSTNPESDGSDVVSGEYTKEVRDKKWVYKMSKNVEASGNVEAYTISLEAVVESANTLMVSISKDGVTTSVWTFQNLDLDYGKYYVNRTGSLSTGYSYSYLRFYSDGKVDYKEVTSAENPNEVDYFANGTYKKTVSADVCIYTCTVFVPATDTEVGKEVKITVNVQTNEILNVLITSQGTTKPSVVYSTWTEQ